MTFPQDATCHGFQCHRPPVVEYVVHPIDGGVGQGWVARLCAAHHEIEERRYRENADRNVEREREGPQR